ncbi:DUF5666 domain-containing protein [Acidithiobacillus sp.]
MTSNKRALVRAGWALLAGLGMLMLSGFGSGPDTPGGIGGTGIHPGGIGGTGIHPGGIGGTGIATLGPIQRFGSIYVNGREYLLTPGTRYLVDGSARPASALHLGDLVVVQAAVSHGKTVADLVRVQHAVIGTISRTDAAAGRITVLGQTIRLDSSTLIRAPGAQTLSFADLKAGNVVAVSALPQGHGQWQALRVTRIATDSAAGRIPLLLRGTVEAIDPVKARLRLGGVWLNTTGHALQDMVVGQEVIAAGSYRGGHPHVRTLRPVRPGLGVVGDRVYMVGYLRRSPQGWRSNGLLLHVGADTRFEGGSVENLRTGTLAVIEGNVEKPGEVAVGRIILGATPMRYGLPPLMRGSEGAGHPEMEPEKPTMERPEIMRPELQRPEILRPEIQRPEIQRPEILRPEVQRPEIMRPAVQRPQITRPQIQQPQMMP